MVDDTHSPSPLEEKQRLLEQLIAAQEQDRQLIAYEIHDTFLQDVIGALMLLDASQEAPVVSAEDHRDQLERARQLLRKSIDRARHLISGLRPTLIDDQGIVAAIESLVSELNARGLEIRYLPAMRERRLSPLLESAIFRIIQEALRNVERHSQTKQVEVQITETPQAIELVIRDVGVGFDPGHVKSSHYGLEGIRQRRPGWRPGDDR